MERDGFTEIKWSKGERVREGRRVRVTEVEGEGGREGGREGG